MSKETLREFLGLTESEWKIVEPTLTQAQRDVYAKMQTVEEEIFLYQNGLGPKPKGVIICGESKYTRES